MKPKTVKLNAGETKTLRVKPKKANAAKKIVGAMKDGEKATAKLKVRLTDVAGNTKTEKLRVRVRR